MYLEQVRNLIAENRIDDALQELSGGATSSSVRNELLNLRRRWSEILRKEESNSEHGHILAVEKSKFTGDLLGFVDRLESKTTVQEKSPKKKSQPIGKIVAGAVSLLLLAVLVIWGIQDGKESSTSPSTENPETTEVVPPQPEEAAPDKPSGRSIFNELMATDNDGSSEYFMANSNGQKMAVAVYFTDALGPGDFDASLTRQVINFAGWEDSATPNGFKNKFHESSLRGLLFNEADKENGKLPSFFPKNCPYDYLVLININGDWDYSFAEANIVAWDIRGGRPFFNKVMERYPQMMGRGGALDPGEKFYNDLASIQRIIPQL